MKNSGFHFVKHTRRIFFARNKNRARHSASRYGYEPVLVEFIQRKRYNVTTARTSNKFQRRHVFTLSRAYGSPPPYNRGPPFSDLTFSVENWISSCVCVCMSAWPLKYSFEKKTSLFSSSSTSLFQDYLLIHDWKYYCSSMNKTIEKIENR